MNPKVGVTYAVSRPLSLYRVVRARTRASRRATTCSPASTISMRSNVAFVGELESRASRRRCMTSRSARRIAATTLDAQANVYSMDFRNEIAPIGALS